MKTAIILEAIHASLLADSAMTSWCVAEFGVAPIIWLGVDDRNPPTDSEYPSVTIVGVEHIRSAATRGSIDWRISIGAGVVNDELVSSGSSRIYTGMLQAETLRELAEDALYRAKISGLTVGIDSNGESSSAGYHPLYVSYATVLVSGLKTTRRGLPG